MNIQSPNKPAITTTQEVDHSGLGNAVAWNEEISGAHEVWLMCQEELEGCDLSREAQCLLHELGFDGENHADVAEAIEERMRESILSLEVRSRWHSPGADAEPGDYQILLTWGGPSLQIIGELNEHAEPCSFRLRYQHWGTPWTEYLDADADALDWFTGLFWYGE